LAETAGLTLYTPSRDQPLQFTSPVQSEQAT
jgi:hypothetical protein